MTKLVPAFPIFPALGQDAIHAAQRTKIDALIQQRGEDLGRSLVPKAFRVQVLQHRLPLGRQQSASGRAPRRSQRDWLQTVMAVHILDGLLKNKSDIQPDSGKTPRPARPSRRYSGAQ